MRSALKAGNMFSENSADFIVYLPVTTVVAPIETVASACEGLWDRLDLFRDDITSEDSGSELPTVFSV
jgi:hypothetical protein